MKKSFLHSIMLGCLSVSSLHATVLPFVGKIIFPYIISEEPCIFYKGNRIPVYKQYNDDGSTLFTYEVCEDKKAQNVSFVVCPRLDLETESNTIYFLKLNETIPYTFLDLTGTRTYSPTGGLAQFSWSAQEKKVTADTAYKLPDDVIIFFFNPEYVQFVVKSWSQDANVRMLPDCVIHKHVARDVVQKELIQAQFVATDMKTVHAGFHGGQKKQYGRIIATMMPK